jgi:hypothetical protein
LQIELKTAGNVCVQILFLRERKTGGPLFATGGAQTLNKMTENTGRRKRRLRIAEPNITRLPHKLKENVRYQKVMKNRP